MSAPYAFTGGFAAPSRAVPLRVSTVPSPLTIPGPNTPGTPLPGAAGFATAPHTPTVGSSMASSGAPLSAVALVAAGSGAPGFPAPPPLPRGSLSAGTTLSSGALDQPLFHQCAALLDRLYAIDDFHPYLEYAAAAIHAATAASSSSSSSGLTPDLPPPMPPVVPVPSLAGALVLAETAKGDPVTLLWTTLRLGEPLAYLYNLVHPDQPVDLASAKAAAAAVSGPNGNNGRCTVPAPTYLPQGLATLNAMKAQVYHCIVGLRNLAAAVSTPGVQQQSAHASLVVDADADIFGIGELYTDDTGGLLKVLRTVRLLLDWLERNRIIAAAPATQSLEPLSATTMARRKSARPATTFGSSTGEEGFDMHGQPLQQGGEEGGLDGSSSKALASAAAGADATADTADLAVTRELTTRDKVLIELLQTERKYVADLERLLGYMTHLSNNNIVSIGVISALFSNLKALVDFQRGFLIGLETVLRSTATGDERVGSLFIQLEPMFSSLYCIFCANFKQASETAMDQVAQLQAASTVMEPTHELPSFLIKPIQRICRYPLLLKELVKRTPDTEFPAATVDDLVAGLESIKRAVDAVNEARRMHENQLVKDDLARRVQDWKGYDIQSFGMLLLHDRFMMLIQDYQRDLVIFLFEKIIVCCKEVPGAATVAAAKASSGGGGGGLLKRKSKAKHQSTVLSSSDSYSTMSSASSSSAGGGNSILGGPPDATYQIKGRIWIGGITELTGGEQHGEWLLTVSWMSLTKVEFFTLKCRNDEQYRQWLSAIQKCVDDSRERGRARAAMRPVAATASSRFVPPQHMPPQHQQQQQQQQTYAMQQQQQLQQQQQAQMLYAAQLQHQQQQQHLQLQQQQQHQAYYGGSSAPAMPPMSPGGPYSQHAQLMYAAQQMQPGAPPTAPLPLAPSSAPAYDPSYAPLDMMPAYTAVQYPSQQQTPLAGSSAMPPSGPLPAVPQPGDDGLNDDAKSFMSAADDDDDAAAAAEEQQQQRYMDTAMASLQDAAPLAYRPPPSYADPRASHNASPSPAPPVPARTGSIGARTTTAALDAQLAELARMSIGDEPIAAPVPERVGSSVMRAGGPPRGALPPQPFQSSPVPMRTASAASMGPGGSGPRPSGPPPSGPLPPPMGSPRVRAGSRGPLGAPPGLPPTTPPPSMATRRSPSVPRGLARAAAPPPALPLPPAPAGPLPPPPQQRGPPAGPLPGVPPPMTLQASSSPSVRRSSMRPVSPVPPMGMMASSSGPASSPPQPPAATAVAEPADPQVEENQQQHSPSETDWKRSPLASTRMQQLQRTSTEDSGHISAATSPPASDLGSQVAGSVVPSSPSSSVAPSMVMSPLHYTPASSAVGSSSMQQPDYMTSLNDPVVPISPPMPMPTMTAAPISLVPAINTDDQGLAAATRLASHDSDTEPELSPPPRIATAPPPLPPLPSEDMEALPSANLSENDSNDDEMQSDVGMSELSSMVEYEALLPASVSPATNGMHYSYPATTGGLSLSSSSSSLAAGGAPSFGLPISGGGMHLPAFRGPRLAMPPTISVPSPGSLMSPTSAGPMSAPPVESMSATSSLISPPPRMQSIEERPMMMRGRGHSQSEVGYAHAPPMPPQPPSSSSSAVGGPTTSRGRRSAEAQSDVGYYNPRGRSGGARSDLSSSSMQGDRGTPAAASTISIPEHPAMAMARSRSNSRSRPLTRDTASDVGANAATLAAAFPARTRSRSRSQSRTRTSSNTRMRMPFVAAEDAERPPAIPAGGGGGGSEVGSSVSAAAVWDQQHQYQQQQQQQQQYSPPLRGRASSGPMVEPIVTALPTPQPQPPQSQRISDGSMTGSAVPQQPMTPPSTSPMASPRVSAQHRSSFLGDLPRDGSNSPSLGGRHLSMSGGAMDTPRVVVPISVIPRSPVVAGSGARTPPQVTRTPSVMSSPSSAPSNVGGGAGGEFANSVIKSRVYHDGQTYVLLLSSGLSYSSLLAMVKRKVGRPATTDVRVKFEDDSGDFILIGGDEDVRTALALAWGRAQAAMSAAGGALSIASAPAALNLFVFDI